MSTVVLMLVTLAVILLPIGLITAQQRRSRQARVTQAWNEALSQQQSKTSELDRIALRLERSLAAEHKLLATVGDLKQRISGLESGNPDQDGLRLIDSQTELAINQMADVLESQLDDEGEARLTELANALAARHADAATALVRMQDVLGHDTEQQASSETEEAPEEEAPEALQASAESTDPEPEAEPEQIIMVPPSADKASPLESQQIH